MMSYCNDLCRVVITWFFFIHFHHFWISLVFILVDFTTFWNGLSYSSSVISLGSRCQSCSADLHRLMLLDQMLSSRLGVRYQKHQALIPWAFIRAQHWNWAFPNCCPGERGGKQGRKFAVFKIKICAVCWFFHTYSVRCLSSLNSERVESV